MSLSDTSAEYLGVVGKATPPLAVSSVAAAGFTLQDWVLIATLLYTIIQATLLLPKLYRMIRDLLNGR